MSKPPIEMRPSSGCGANPATVRTAKSTAITRQYSGSDVSYGASRATDPPCQRLIAGVRAGTTHFYVCGVPGLREMRILYVYGVPGPREIRICTFAAFRAAD